MWQTGGVGGRRWRLRVWQTRGSGLGEWERGE